MFSLFPIQKNINIFRYTALYHSHLCDSLFTGRKICLAFLTILTFHAIFYWVYFLLDAAGFDEVGVCGVMSPTVFLKCWSQIGFSVIFVAYAVSTFCATKVLKKISEHRLSISSDFVVSFLFRWKKESLWFTFRTLVLNVLFRFVIVCKFKNHLNLR